MKRLFVHAICLLLALSVQAEEWSPAEWPVLKHYDHEYLHYEGRPVNHHGFPRFSEASFDAAYPFGQVRLADKALPVRVTVKGFNPLIPGDADNSGLPVAVLSYEVTNLTDAPWPAGLRC